MREAARDDTTRLLTLASERTPPEAGDAIRAVGTDHGARVHYKGPIATILGATERRKDGCAMGW